jgi:hypothetical protein
MADPKIVDAISATDTAGVNVTQNSRTQTVPVKIDGSALAGMMSKIAASQQQPVEYISPSEYVLSAGNRMKDMYERYDVLRKLGGALHGKSFNDPIPQDLRIESVTIKFRLPDDTETNEAKVFNVACVGDIAQLLSTEMGTIILSLQQEAKALTELSKSTEDTAAKAREAWESSNKDRKIVMAGGNNVGTTTAANATAEKPLVGEVSLSDEN